MNTMEHEPSNTEEIPSLLQPLSNKSVVDRIIDSLTKAIIAKELQPGQKIPTEIELCESMRVGRNSVREAIKVLVTMGVLVIKRSEGTFVTEGFSERMLDPLVYGLILEAGDSSDIVELRKLIETGVFRYALIRRTDEDLLRLEKAYQEMERQVRIENNEDGILQADINFHHELYSLLKNPLLEKISAVIERLTLPFRRAALDRLLAEGGQEVYLSRHYEMLKSVRDQNFRQSDYALDDHFEQWRNYESEPDNTQS